MAGRASTGRSGCGRYIGTVAACPEQDCSQAAAAAAAAVDNGIIRSTVSGSL
jgi:hypothetical protein